jgi:hypothetical protein
LLAVAWVPRKPRAKCDSAPQPVDIQSKSGILAAIQISWPDHFEEWRKVRQMLAITAA